MSRRLPRSDAQTDRSGVRGRSTRSPAPNQTTRPGLPAISLGGLAMGPAAMSAVALSAAPVAAGVAPAWAGPQVSAPRLGGLMVYLMRSAASVASWFGGTAEAKVTGPIQLDRARRLHTTHQRGPGRRCGLCLQSWPCTERSWADRTLRGAAPTTGSRWPTLRWSNAR
jgi:hypothetical protein